MSDRERFDHLRERLDWLEIMIAEGGYRRRRVERCRAHNHDVEG